MGLASFNRMRDRAKKIESAKADISTEQHIEALIKQIDKAKADDVRVVAAYFDIKYTTKPEAISAIKAEVDKGVLNEPDA